jgi:hypothetical protein
MKGTRGWGVAIIAAFAAVIFFAGLNSGAVRSEIGSAPVSGGAAFSQPGNIIASSPAMAKLVVYSYDGLTYQLSSTIEPESSPFFDVGDVDNDSLPEIAVACFQTGGTKKNPTYTIGVRIYKEGVSGVWKSCSIPVSSLGGDQILIADVDNDALNEILVVGHYNLVIFKYNSESRQFTVLRQISSPSIGGIALNLQSVAVAPYDVNGDGLKEIYVSSIITGDIDRTLRGYLLIYPGYQPSAPVIIPADGHLVNGQLRLGDISGDGDFEICSTSADFDPATNLYQSLFYVWDKWGTVLMETKLKPDSSTLRYYDLDIGELSSVYPGKEIVVGGGQWLAVYGVNGSSLGLISERTDFPLMPYGGINEFRIEDSNGDGVNDINVCGAAGSRKGTYGSYFAVFDKGLNFIWEYAGSPRTEGEISKIAVVK